MDHGFHSYVESPEGISGFLASGNVSSSFQHSRALCWRAMLQCYSWHDKLFGASVSVESLSHNSWILWVSLKLWYPKSIGSWSVWNYGSPLKSGKELRAETGRNSHEPRESGQKTKEIWYVWHFYLSMTLACYCRKHIPVLIMVLHILSMFYLYLVKVLEIIPWFWVNYDVSLTWIKVIWGMIALTIPY